MKASEVDAFIHFACTVAILRKLTRLQLEELFEEMKKSNFQSGELIVHENSNEENSFYIIFSGRLKVLSIGQEGEEQIHSVLEPGDFFGEMSLLEDKPRSASVVAKENCQLYILEKRQFFQALEKYPVMAIELLKILSERLRKSNKRVCDYSFMTAPEKVASYLKNLVDVCGKRVEDGSVQIDNMPTQGEIGAMIGNSRETVSRILNDLERQGIIYRKSRKKVVVLDEESL